MPPNQSLLRGFRGWWIPLTLPLGFGGLKALQTVYAGHGSAPLAFWQEAQFWFCWGLNALFVFELCYRLYAGRHSWRYQVIGLVLGSLAVAVLQPLLMELIDLGKAAWTATPAVPTAPSFGMRFRTRAINGVAPVLVLYVATVCIWYAVTYYRDLKERQLKTVELESMLRQSQLQALQSQLHPHFLFNTLHSIAELVHRNPALAERLVLGLADLLRKVLRSPTVEEVTLAHELEFIRDYVDIEQMRLGDRLKVDWQVREDVLHSRVPSLILQPLVENAIQHGIAAVARGGRLLIRAEREGDFLKLEIRDTGPGIAQEALAGREGIGLTNTRNRLQRLYGDQQGFELRNDHGLVVNVRLPYSEGTRNGAHAMAS